LVAANDRATWAETTLLGAESRFDAMETLVESGDRIPYLSDAATIVCRSRSRCARSTEHHHDPADDSPGARRGDDFP
jgi:hypothetical protein